MHWLVEVSRVGDTVASERYCIDARRWQSALQEARRMRGDSGALPKLTIELTDNGYRAVDPALKVRYVVTEAPPGMPLTDGARVLLSTAPPPVVESIVPSKPPLAGPSAAVAAVPIPPPVSEQPPAPAVLPSSHENSASEPVAAAVPSVAPAPVSSRPPAPLLSTQVIRQREERPTEANPIAYREVALAVRAGASRTDVEALLLSKLEEARAGLSEDTRRYVQLAVFDHVFVKRPVRPPLGTLQWKDWRGEPTLSFPGFGEGSDTPPPSSVSTSRMPSWSRGMMTSVAPVGASTIPPVVNHSSAHPRVPASAPSASASAPPPGLKPVNAPRPDSVIPTRVVSVGPSSPASVARILPVEVVSPPVPTSPPPAPVPTAPPAPVPTAPPAVMAPAIPTSPPAASVAPLEPVADEDPPLALTTLRVPTEPPAAHPSQPAETVQLLVERRSDPALARRSDPALARRSDPALVRRSDPHVSRRRASNEDLIGDLFERMHELAFMPDIVSGADFVVRVLGDLIPCEATLVHVFDLGRREFVVVRARGPHATGALMFRTPDTDPLVIDVMRRPSMMPNGVAPKHSAAFDALGVNPTHVMVRGARQGGRYLGMIELGNPLGGTPFHEAEVNALEYVCEQFADFVASRPVVLDEDIVRA